MVIQTHARTWSDGLAKGLYQKNTRRQWGASLQSLADPSIYQLGYPFSSCWVKVTLCFAFRLKLRNPMRSMTNTELNWNQLTFLLRCLMSLKHWTPARGLRTKVALSVWSTDQLTRKYTVLATVLGMFGWSLKRLILTVHWLGPTLFMVWLFTPAPAKRMRSLGSFCLLVIMHWAE